MSLVGAEVRSFSQSLGVLLGVQRRFGDVHAVILLDGGSRVVDGLAFTDGRPEPDAAVDAGLTTARAHAAVVRRALLLSVGAGSVAPCDDVDVARWHRYVAAFAEVDVELVDWLASDGEHIRSYALTADDTSWRATCT